MKITFVKKILASGEPCAKCKVVEERMVREGFAARIDETLIADERDPASPGMVLAGQHRVERAPFFVVTESDGSTRVFEQYVQFVKDVLSKAVSDRDEATDLVDQHAGLDLL